MSTALIRLRDSVCQHDKTKTAENKIAKLGMGIANHDTSPINEHASDSPAKYGALQMCFLFDFDEY